MKTVTLENSSGRPASYHPDFLLGLYERLVLIREFEERVKFLFLEGTMPGTIHQCQGQEATATGVCAALNADDFITSTFRGHGHALAKGDEATYYGGAEKGLIDYPRADGSPA